MAGPAFTETMSVHNGEPCLGESIASVLAQSFTDLKVPILDDSSQDASRARTGVFAPSSARIAGSSPA
jgi:hypothetical protein